MIESNYPNNVQVEHRDAAAPSIPLLTRERFAELIGLPVSVLVAQTEKGYWPTLKIGKRVFINVALVHQQCLERAFK